MADNRYMLHEKSRPPGTTFAKGYQDHISNPIIAHAQGKRKPLFASTIDDGFVTKTETTVEYTRVPLARRPGNISPTKMAPVSTVVTETSRPYKTGPLGNLYWWQKPNSNGNAGTYGLPSETRTNNYNKPSDTSMRQTDTAVLHQTHIDSSFGNNEKVPDGKQESIVTNTNGWAKLHAPIIDTRQTDTSIRQPHFDSSFEKNEKVPDGKQEAIVTNKDRWAKPHAPIIDMRQSDSSIRQSHFDSSFGNNEKVPYGKQEAIVTNTDGWAKPHVLIIDMHQTDTSIRQPHFDSSFGNNEKVPYGKQEPIVTNTDGRAKPHTQIIDSKEAAWKYRGEIM